MSLSRYWKFQLIGWLGYSAVGITINSLYNPERLGSLLASHIVFVAVGIGLTHLLRQQIHRRRSPFAPITTLWPLLTGSAFAISAILATVVIGLNVLLADGKWDLVSAAALWWGMLLAIGVWTILYVRFSEQRQNEIREEQLQLSLRDAQLRTLESQINPHFLFNSLNSIRALVEMDPARAQDMLTRLANVLRNSLRHADGHTVTLGAELETVSDYLALEAVRFGDRLHSEVQIDQAAAQCQIPPMVLHTLVENAIKHGIGQTKGPGKLLIQALVFEQMLLLAVENTGKLRESTGDGVHHGLRNIRERLALLYGDRAKLQLEGVGERVKATVAIPVLG